MTLRDWLTSTNTTAAELARQLGVSRQSVFRYLSGSEPPHKTYVRLVVLTRGQVTKDDFPTRRKVTKTKAVPPLAAALPELFTSPTSAPPPAPKFVSWAEFFDSEKEPL